MPARRRRGAWLTIPALVASVVMVSSQTASAANSGQPDASSRFKATALTASSTITAAKSTTGRLAVTDKALVDRTDSALVNVMVKLDFDATASYAGSIKGLPATSPRVTGRALTGSTAAEETYETYTKGLTSGFRSAVRAKLPKAQIGRTLTRVYGGVAVRLPANQVKTLLTLPHVAAVQADTLNKVQTDSSTTFIGAPTIWAQEGGKKLAGKGVIFGDLDTGVWPEHPSFTDVPALGNPPAKADGTPRVCNFGDNPLTPATDVFVCNHKLIGGDNFLDTYNANVATPEVYPTTARDSGGHGTHTTTTAAGGVVAHAPIFGVDHGPISGVAPGAWVIEYKVCGLEGCFGSDTAAAVEQAILDGVDVINYSISGGSNPYADATELAFLDAYDAGVTVAASAGNSGPGAGTTDHHSPWVITVAASTQTRDFESTLTLTAGAATATFVGASITGAIPSAPVVLAQNIPGYDALCSTELAPGAAAGKIVACQRGTVGRVQKGYNVLQGGAVGMILYNLPLADTETDNHFLPVVHLADGTAFLAFMAAHPTATASSTAGTKGTGQGDVMASFSSRGPGGLFLKPDITAPGVQILAGNTPTPDEIPSGPAGEYYQAIAGTSMSAPHIAGSAILLQALHPSWGPGAIKSAIMTTANTNVVKEDATTPADPFDDGSGRVDLTKAGAAPVVFEDSALNMYQYGNDPLTAMNVNIASINVPTMPGTVKVTRTAKNVSGKSYAFKVSTTMPNGSSIRVSPSSGTIKAGKSQTFQITIYSSAPTGQYFGQITLKSSGKPTLHLPVAFYNKQGSVSLDQSCAPTSVKVGHTTTCTVTATNNSFGTATVSATSAVTGPLKIVGSASAGPTTLEGQKDAIPAIDPIDPAITPSGGYLDLGLFGITPTPMGDETNTNFNVPAYVFGGKTYSAIGVDSNGYIVVGGSSSQSDISYEPQTFPDVTAPNGVLAPYWTDLNGAGAPGLSVATLGDGVSSWLVVQWDTFVYGDDSPAGVRQMQAWIGVNGTEDITYAYSDATDGVDAPAGTGLTVGAENPSGTAGAQITGPPTGMYVVTSSPGEAGGSLTYTVKVKGTGVGNGYLKSEMTADTVAGTTKVSTKVKVSS